MAKKNDAERNTLLDCPNCFDDTCCIYDDPDESYVYCPNCGMQGPISISQQEAFDSWNNLPRRAL